MNKFTKALLLLILGCFLWVGSAFALPVGTNLETVFNDIAVDGANDVDVYTDYITDGNDAYWNIGATGTSAASFIIEIAGYASTNLFGIYDKNDSSNRVVLFDGSDTTSDKLTVSIDIDGNVLVADLTDRVFRDGIFSSTTFGYYLDVAETGNTYFSDTALNVDKFDHMLAYEGVGEMVDIDLKAGPIPAGQWGSNEYILAFEDLLNGGDKDFADMVIMVESVNPVPEPATMVLFGIGLLGLAGVSRRKIQA